MRPVAGVTRASGRAVVTETAERLGEAAVELRADSPLTRYLIGVPSGCFLLIPRACKR
jgi:hypothetical protein